MVRLIVTCMLFSGMSRYVRTALVVSLVLLSRQVALASLCMWLLSRW